MSGVALRFGHRAKESVELLGCEVKELSDSESEKKLSIHWLKVVGWCFGKCLLLVLKVGRFEKAIM